MAAPNPYDAIGIPRGATKEKVRESFRKRALVEHPDVNPDDPQAAERFTDLVNAYNKIMGDELLPDELTTLRVRATKRYRDKLEQEFRGQIEIGRASSFLPMITPYLLLGGFMTWLGQQPVETLDALGLSLTPLKYQ
eukprot:CAMPEP_0117471654 /NCGR_PEP_ID=MMETSP0784-20121206/7841_1 /TAXON_ID=39447 /ORGANISM="" /LENGTH=136 /DNA_ID=CAMNT_0005265777 /DNA_START=319 /DNA_END=729 /DNA_ORIENTATION=+